jgi:Sugar-transfer associated ATP-grasp
VLLIGSAGSRRTTLLQAAAQRRGARLLVIEWREVLAHADTLDAYVQRAIEAGHRWCKIDPPPAQLTDALIAHGWQLLQPGSPQPSRLQHGELTGQHWWYAGLRELLTRIAARLHSLQCLNPPEQILLMCDKWACQQHLRRHGVHTPELLARVHSMAQFEQAFPARDHPAVFIKARYGSSAAGVIALRRHRDGRMAAYTSARLVGDRIYNHLRISRYSQRCAIQQLIDRLCEQGAYAERWTPKPRVPTAARLTYDLRVVAFCGAARQLIARLSESPLTNLHLGNRRAQPSWFDAAQVEALNSAIERAAASFAGSRNIGFDVSLYNGRVAVFEANAFGDLLPDLHHEGATTYDDQMRLVSHDEC